MSNRLVPNRNVIFNIARTYEALGEYPDAFRYYVQALEQEPNAARRPAIEEALARIRPNVAVIHVQTDPPGATVYINRRDLGGRGNTPRLLGFQPGKHKIIVDLEGYEPAEVENVEAKTGEQTTVAIKLKRIVGTVRVVGETAGTQVRVNDASGPVACTAPCDLTLPPGRHRLYLSQEGYQPSEQDVNVAAGTAVPARYRLNPLTGSLVVNADERDALVEVDGKPMGFTPAVLNVQSGQRRVRVSLRGFRPVEQVVNVVASQQTRIDLSLRQLEEVEAASRSTEAVEDAPGSVTIIPGQELRAMGYPTVAEALRGVRGLYTTYDGVYTFAGVRGINLPGDFGNRMLTLLNGHSMNDSWVNLSYFDYLARTDLEDVERIEIVRGPGSVLYGTGAFSGVVNVVTKGRPTATSVGLGVGTADNSLIRGRASFQLPLGRDSGVWMSVGAARSLGRDYYFGDYRDHPTSSDPRPEPTEAVPNPPDDPLRYRFDGHSRNNDKFTVGTLQGRLWLKSFSAQWYLNSRSKTVPNGVATTQLGVDNTFYQDTRGFLELSLAPRFGDKLATLTRASINMYQFEDRLWYYPEYIAPRMGMYQVYDKETFDDIWLLAEQRVEFSPIPQLKITAGAEAQIHFTAAQRGVDTGCDSTGCYPFVYLPLGTLEEDKAYDKHPYNILAAYALVDIMPSERLRISAGSRFDYYSTLDDPTPVPSPRVALIVKPYEGGNLKVTGGRAFRAPSIQELFYGYAVPAVNEQGYDVTYRPAPDLEPESVWSGEVEFTHRLSSTVSALGAAYVNHLSNLIFQQGSQTVGDPTRYENTEDPILVVGGEAELRREWRQGWMASVSYSYAKAQYLEDAGVNQLRAVPNSPEHMGSVRGAVPLFGKALGLASRLTVEAPRYDRNVRANPDISQTKTDPVVIWDIVLSGQVDVGGLRYNVGVYNVGDWRWTAPTAAQYTIAKFPQNGRTFLASLNMNL
ncbi:TonB-dependent receptor domain-containing protein [Sorangium cellulosum]|uniref:TonB-dependent receptor n=1 Tax=Sorangium cellulosum TaxID=56 RepID=A0A150QQK0_SORCE|nr:TonB-dependent receptor [Sorangium cellulosum]KYF70285.1 TonB-dependent receptor [Sorangium cellulosum]